MKSNVLELPSATLEDIPRMLRAIADEMEAGEYGKTQMLVVAMEEDNGNVRTFGGGGADWYRAIALFHLGIENLLAKRGREYMV
jgi:hypothetical protein